MSRKNERAFLDRDYTAGECAAIAALFAIVGAIGYGIMVLMGLGVM